MKQFDSRPSKYQSNASRMNTVLRSQGQDKAHEQSPVEAGESSSGGKDSEPQGSEYLASDHGESVISDDIAAKSYRTYKTGKSFKNKL